MWRPAQPVVWLPDDDLPVYGTIASQFNDPGLTWMFVNLCRLLREKLKKGSEPFFEKGSDPSC